MSDAATLKKLMEPFELDEIELLPRFTGKKVDLGGGRMGPPRDSYKQCAECGGYHPFPCVHLSYVGHAGITRRLLEVDPAWSWEPMALTDKGTPLMADGGMWIRLTVAGVTRIGFGDAQGKTGPNATKEIIGDALRNAAMRFGVGTYLWSKSEKAKAELTRSGAEDDESEPAPEPKKASKPAAVASEKQIKFIWVLAKEAGITEEQLHKGIQRDFEVDHVDLLTSAQARQLIDKIKPLADAAKEAVEDHSAEDGDAPWPEVAQ